MSARARGATAAALALALPGCGEAGQAALRIGALLLALGGAVRLVRRGGGARGPPGGTPPRRGGARG